MERPRLLILRPSLDNLSNHFKDVGFYNREKGLSLFFETTIVEENFDLKYLTDTHKPDLIAIMFDPCTQGGMVQLINKEYNSEIPRVIIPIFDAYSLYRWNVYCVFKETKANAIFTYDTSFGAYYPSLIPQTFQWHEFIDPTVFKNYLLPKQCDILLAGSFIANNYPWRRDVLNSIKKFNYQELIHWDRDKPNEEKKSVVKEEFSKIINQSKITPTCGGHSKIVLGKHFEIPASYSCLITEQSEALDHFGFKNRVNCVFANKENIEQTITELLSNTDKLEKVTNAGFEFVKNNHTAENRSEIFDWFMLNKQKSSKQRVIQSSPLKGLKLVAEESKEQNFFITDVPPVKLTEKGDTLLIKGEYKEAENHYNFFNLIDPDASNVVIRKALLCLYKGDLKGGVDCFSKITEHELTVGKAMIIDPVELFIFCLLLYKKNEFKTIIELCSYTKNKLASLESESLHLEVLHCLSLYKSEGVKSGLPNSINQYTFCSSHEFLNIDFNHLVTFLRKTLGLEKKELSFLNELKGLPATKNEQNHNYPTPIKNRQDLISTLNKYIFSPSFSQKIYYKLKSVSKKTGG